MGQLRRERSTIEPLLLVTVEFSGRQEQRTIFLAIENRLEGAALTVYPAKDTTSCFLPFW